MQKGGLFHLLTKVVRYDFNRWFRNKDTDPEKFTFEDSTLLYQGISMAMMITALPWLESYGLIIGAIAIIAILFLKNRSRQPQVAGLLLFLILTGVGILIVSGVAFADDGGWIEGGGNFRDWLLSDGAKRAIALGLTAGMGGLFGPILVNILNNLGLGLVPGGGVGGGTGPGGDQTLNDPLKNNTDDLKTEETEETEEEEEESDFFLSIQGQRGVLNADGKDSIWFFAKVHSSNPEVDPAVLNAKTQGIHFDFSGPGDDWIQAGGQQYSQGHKVIQVRALAPESADPEEDVSVTISAASGGEHDSVSFRLKVVYRPVLELSFDGPSGIRPDGQNSTNLEAKIRFFPDNPDLEAEVADSIGFHDDSEWVNLGAITSGSGQKSCVLTAYPAGGDFSQEQPETISIRVLAHYKDDTLEKTIDLALNDLDAWIEIKIDQASLPVYKKQETYVHARVMLQAGSEAVNSEELTQTLQIREAGEEGDWLVASQPGISSEELYFTVYAWYPYEDAGEEVPSENKLTVYTDEGDKPLDAEVVISLIPYPEGQLVVTEPDEALRPDIEQIVQVKVGIELIPDDEEIDKEKILSSLLLDLVNDQDSWLVLYEGVQDGEEMVFDIGCENQSGEESAEPPDSSQVKISGSVFGKDLEEIISIDLEPLPLPEINIVTERSENTANPNDSIYPDGDDFISLLASLTMEGEIEGVNLEELTENLVFELLGSAGSWIELSEEAFEGGGEPVKYVDVFGLLKSAEERKKGPATVVIKVQGELAGREFSKDKEIKLIQVPELELDYQYDRKIESSIPEDQLSLTGEDWIEVLTWFKLIPKLESINQSEIQEKMKFWHLNDSDQYISFSEETAVETGDGYLGRSIKLSGILPDGIEANDIPDAVNIRIASTFMGEEVEEEIPIRLLGKPILEIDKDEVILGSGEEDQKITVIAEIENTIDKGWQFKIEPEPQKAKVEFEASENRCEIVFSPGELPEGADEPQDEEVKIVAYKGDFELEQPLKITLSPIGLFIISDMPLTLPIEEKEVSCAYSVRVVEDGEAKFDYSAMQSGMTLSNPIEDSEDEVVQNACKQAGFTMQFDDFYGEYGGEEAQAAKYKFAIENVLPGPVNQFIEVPITISVSGKEEPVFSREIMVRLALHNMDEINKALEKSRCEEIVKKYIPEEKKEEFYQMIDEQEEILGAEGYFEMRKIIWERASEMLLQEAAEWDNYADWLQAAEPILQVAEFVGDLAFRVLISATLSPMASASAGMVKSLLVSGINNYLAGGSFYQLIVQTLGAMIIQTPGELLFDPDTVAKVLPKPAAYAVYFTYKFFWYLCVDKENWYTAGALAFKDVSVELIVNKVTPYVKEIGKNKGYISQDDLMTLDGKFRNPDEMPLGNPVHPEAFGIPVNNAAAIQKMSSKYGVELSFRQTNPFCLERLYDGHPPKPVQIKAKTINGLDVMLGANPKNTGLVGFFQPDPPTLKPGMSAGMFDALNERYHKRIKEFNNCQADIYNLELEGKIKIEDGVIINTGLHPKGNGKAFSGDNDGWAFQGKGGKKMTQDQIQAVENELVERGLGEHGAHEHWDAKTEKDIEAKTGIINDEGRIIVFGPDQSCPTVGDSGMYNMDLKK